MSERVARSILDDAAKRGLGPGDQLPSEPQMAEHYRVGRISVREALRILEVHGVVGIGRGRGKGPQLERLKARSVATTLRLYFQVRNVTYEDVLDTRLAIEPLLIERAAERATEAERCQLVEAAEAVQPIPSDDYDQVGAALLRLSAQVGAAAHNPCLALFGHALADIHTQRASAYYHYSAYFRTDKKLALTQAQALAAGDTTEARALTVQRIDREYVVARRRYPEVLAETVRWSI
jgi:GntR family transcriptional regulator, transcriptional repressor for pyruvate dehydrogenase complex